MGRLIPSMDRLVQWWERGLRISLCVSIVLIGTGRIELSLISATLSAWSVSRTTFFFWLIWKLLVWLRAQKLSNAIGPLRATLPLLVFFSAVSASLLSDLRDLSDYRYLFFAVMHCLMIVDVLPDDKSRRFLVLALGVTPGLLLARGVIADPLVLGFNLTQRLGYPLDHPNTLGHLLAMSIPLGVVVTICARGWLRPLAAVSSCAQVAAWLLTYSRGAWLGLAVALLFLVFALGARREIIVLAGIAALLIIFVEPLRERFSSVFNARADAAVTERMQVMRDTLRVGLANPVLGVGYGRGKLKAAIRASAASETKSGETLWHAHNLYLQLFAGTGMAGVGAFVWVWGGALSRTLRGARRVNGDDRILTLGIAASALAFLVCALSDVTFHHHETRLFCFTLLALMLLPNSERDGSGVIKTG